jgi:hypothetical protein
LRQQQVFRRLRPSFSILSGLKGLLGRTKSLFELFVYPVRLGPVTLQLLHHGSLFLMPLVHEILKHRLEVR